MRISDWSPDVCSSDLRHLAWHSLNLPDVARGLGIPVVHSFHDYYAICPTVNLIDRNGHYHPRGVADDAENALWPDDPLAPPMTPALLAHWQIGRASCRERVCQYV